MAAIDEQLAFEAKQRPRAGVAAILGGVLLLVGNILPASIYREFPTQPLLDALSLAQRGEASTIKVQQVEYFESKFGLLVLDGVLLAIAALCLAVALQMLLRATSFRKIVPGPDEPKRQDFLGVARVIALAGPVILAVAYLAYYVLLALDARSFVDGGERSEDAATDVLEGDVVVAAATTQPIASLMVGFAFVILCLAAMRVGLLTRFMGVLGIFVGVLFVIPIGSPVPIVPAFWLIALGVLFLGRWPNGVPPAWASGKAEPWPSRQAMIEQARAERESRQGAASGGRARSRLGEDEDARPAPAAAAEAGAPVPASKRKKRKRR